MLYPKTLFLGNGAGNFFNLRVTMEVKEKNFSHLCNIVKLVLFTKYILLFIHMLELQKKPVREEELFMN